MKISNYTFILPQEDNCTILYNCRFDTLAVVESGLANLIYPDSLKEINTRHKSFFDFLMDRGFIVRKDSKEEQEVIEDWKKLTWTRMFSVFS